MRIRTRTHRANNGRHAASIKNARVARGRHRAATGLRLGAVLAVVVAAVAAYAGSVTNAPDASAKGKIKCKAVVGRAAVDPIVAHGKSGPSEHNHTFFGNTTLLSLPNPNAATYEQMVGKSTNCENPDDSAIYWMPTLVYTSGAKAGQPVPIHSYRAYYRSFDHKDTGEGQAYPADVRLVAGNAMATKPQPTREANWSCGQYSSVPTGVPTIPNCAAATGRVVRLTAHITFPSCWDGKLANHDVVGDTRDNAHFAYPDQRMGGACPAGFPIKTTELRETFSWEYRGTGQDVALVSDKMVPGAKPGQTLHSDYWNTWVQSGFEKMVADCVNSNRGSAAECG